MPDSKTKKSSGRGENKNGVIIRITRIIPDFWLPLMHFALSIRRTAGDGVTNEARGGR
jgi:hypothetical protein